MNDNTFIKPISEENKTTYYKEVKEGLELFNKGDHVATLDYFNNLAGKWSEQPEIVFALGVVSYEFNRRGHAIQMFERAHQLDPECKDYVDALAFAYTKHGRLADGLYYAKVSLTTEPHPFFKPLCPPKLSNFTGALLETSPSNNYLRAFSAFHARNIHDALELCNMELNINPRHADCLHLMAEIQLLTGHYHKAVQTMRALAHIRPDTVEDEIVLAEALCKAREFAQARVIALKLAETEWKNPVIFPRLRRIFPELGESKKLNTVARRWENKFSITRADKPGFAFDPASGRKIRVGILTDAAYNSIEAELLFPLLRFRDGNRFETILYTTNLNSDVTTSQMLRLADEHRSMQDIDGYTASMMITGDSIDILVDATLTPNEDHLEIMAERPSPVQIAWHGSTSPFGYVGTDYVLSDAVTFSVDKKSLNSHQKLASLRSGLFAMPHFTQYPDVQVHENVRDGQIVYGVQYDPARLNSEFIADCAAILKANPNALLLFGNAPNVCVDTRTALISEFGNYGLAGRIRFQEYEQREFAKSGKLLSKEFFTNIDILLDTSPVSGTFEVIEALWMGVPTISLIGKSREGTHGASILNAAGHFEWAAKSHKDFVRKAVKLGANGEQLFELRNKLRAELSQSSLFNPQNFVRDMENVYMTILNR